MLLLQATTVNSLNQYTGRNTGKGPPSSTSSVPAFSENPDTWHGMVVCEEPNKRIANAHVGRLFGASRVIEHRYWRYRIEYCLNVDT